MNFNQIAKTLLAGIGTLVASSAFSAVVTTTSVTSTFGGTLTPEATVGQCSDGPGAGLRAVNVEGARLTNGLCYTQNGNLDPSFSNTTPKTFSADGLVLTLLDKLVVKGGATSGQWALDLGADNNSLADWTTYSRMFLGFHFGGGGDKNDTNPDSFVVELANLAGGGKWELTTQAGVSKEAKLTDISNLYIFGIPGEEEGGGGGNCAPGQCQNVPEPATGALAGAALLGLALRRRMGGSSKGL